MTTLVTCNVHTDESTKITCEELRTAHRSVSTLRVDGVIIFADNADLRRLSDAINVRLAEIAAEAMRVAA
jgi:hypothetical protein